MEITQTIYERPQDYDLEHEGDTDDIRFYRLLVRRWRPSRLLEFGAGSGRIATPLADLAASPAEQLPTHIVGVDIADAMLAEAERKRTTLSSAARERLTLVKADIRTWRGDAPFDLVIAPCSALTHLLTIDDQLAAWRAAYDNLAPGGRFVVDLTMPNLCVYAESMQTPPRTTVEIDIDTRDAETGDRMLRHKTTEYLADEQRARIRFLYDRLSAEVTVDRYVSDFECHVYYPREVELLFRCSGFSVEAHYGDYSLRPFKRNSQQMLMVGRKTDRQN